MTIAGSFQDEVRRLADLVVPRLIVDEDERRAIYRLRYDGYLRDGVIEPNDACEIVDRYDGLPNNPVVGFFFEGKLAGTLRIGVCSPDNPDVPATAIFPEVIEPLVAAGKTLIDPTRFVLDRGFAISHPKLVYVALRVAWMVSDHMDADYTLATVRAEHQAFYRRFFGHKQLAEPRPYLALIKPLGLMALHCPEHREQGYARYPFLRTTRDEFMALMAPVYAAPSMTLEAALDEA